MKGGLLEAYDGASPYSFEFFLPVDSQVLIGEDLRRLPESEQVCDSAKAELKSAELDRLVS